MVLRRLLLGSIISSLYLVVGQTITCYNCTSSRTCSPSKDVCTATACYIVTEDNYMASGCATDAVTFTVNNTNVAGLCYRPDNITRVCACHTASCNTRLDSDAFPDVDMTILQSLNISSLMEIAQQPPVTQASVVTTGAPETTTKAGLRNAPIDALYYGNIRSGVVPAKETLPQPVMNEGTLRPHVCGFNPFTRQCMDPQGYCPGRCMNFHYTYNTIYECRCLVI
ncbi:unnamed protein product, partial [Mesorhabditis spiculigera]